MLYEIDSFGFIDGYVHDNWTVMSKADLLQDKKLRTELERVQYEDWKKHNIVELKERWKSYGAMYYDSFERYCKMRYRKNNP